MTNQIFLNYSLAVIGGLISFLSVLFIYYVRGIKLSFEELKKPFGKMQQSMSDLNTKIAVVISDRQNDKEDIAIIRQDLKDHLNKV